MWLHASCSSFLTQIIMKNSASRSSAPFTLRAINLAVIAAYSLPLSFALISPTAHAQSTNADIQRAEVQANRPSSLPTEIPTTIEGISAKQIERDINATDAQDALKYLPSLLVRKRYIGDYNHAVLATRASGTGNSARSLVYADGILLSNLLGNGAGFTPRWGNVTPEEIERVDVLYGPFSAAYSGNSVGAVVDYITRMPRKFEAHLKLTGYSQDFKLLGIDKTYSGAQGSATIGDRVDRFSWWLNINRAKSHGQPQVFANKLVTGAPDSSGTQVTGAILSKNPKNQDWWLIGTTTQYDTTQDHAKIKLSYDITSSIKAAYTLGYWSNSADDNVESFLKDSAGNAVYSGNVNLGGRKYAISAADFAPNKNAIAHISQGLSVKSHSKGIFDWEIAASDYDYSKDILRASTTAVLPAALTDGAGRITDQKGTGWNTFALKGIYRPNPVSKEHTIEFGYQRDTYQLRTLVSNTGNWISGTAGSRVSAFNGDTSLQSLYAQDAWRIDTRWKTIVVPNNGMRKMVLSQMRLRHCRSLSAKRPSSHPKPRSLLKPIKTGLTKPPSVVQCACQPCPSYTKAASSMIRSPQANSSSAIPHRI
jgi:iron complex outermembrane recepter protein